MSIPGLIFWSNTHTNIFDPKKDMWGNVTSAVARVIDIKPSGVQLQDPMSTGPIVVLWAPPDVKKILQQSVGKTNKLTNEIYPHVTWGPNDQSIWNGKQD